MRYLLFLFVPALLLSSVMPGDERYLVHRDPAITLIYPQSLTGEAAHALGFFQSIAPRYDQSFNYRHRRPPYLALASGRNQIANAWASAVPFPQMTLYGGGAQMIDYFGHEDWLATLIAHEGAHLYQLDAKASGSRILERLFGHNAMPIFPLVPLPLFTLPNLWMPDLILEGSAIYNESRFAPGGRLQGGRHRALFLALLAADKLDANRLLNNHQSFPYLEEKYVVGAYFWAYLADRYGAEKVDGIFRLHGGRLFNPLRLNSSFHAYFGVGFYELLDEFLTHYRPMAEQMRLAQGELVAESQSFAPLGGDEHEIWIYLSDRAGSSEIRRLNRKTLEQTHHKGHYLPGRPFCLNQTCATAAAGLTASLRQEPSLFDARRRPIDSFNNQILLDRRHQSRLYYDGAQSVIAPQLYRDSTPLGRVHSAARFGLDGAVYTVRQSAKGRTFYRDDKQLFTLQSPAVLADVLPDSSVLFTAPTLQGNGLFVWHNQKIKQLGLGDNILDARWVKGDLFLIATLNADGYAYYLSRFEMHANTPQTYRYGYHDQGSLPKPKAPIQLLEQRAYNPLAMLRFASLYPGFYVDENSWRYNFDALFVDPLGFNQLTLGYRHHDDASAYLGYENRQHRLYFGGELFGDMNASTVGNERIWGAEIHAGYLLYRRENTRSDLLVRRQHDPDDDRINPLIASLSFGRQYGYALLSEPALGYSAALHGRTNSGPNGGEQAVALDLHLHKQIVGPTYARIDLKGTQAKDGSYLLIREAGRWVRDPTHIALLDLTHTYGAKNAISGRLRLKGEIAAPLYFPRLPFGLHGINPVLTAQRVDFEWFGSTDRYQIDEVVGTLEFEMLFAHRFDFLLEAGVVKNSEQEKPKSFLHIKVGY